MIIQFFLASIVIMGNKRDDKIITKNASRFQTLMLWCRVNGTEQEGCKISSLSSTPTATLTIFSLHPYFIHTQIHCWMENNVSILAVYSFMFYRDKRWKKVLCIVYYTTKKTFDFVFLDVRLIIAFQTCNREFFVWILCRFSFSHIDSSMAVRLYVYARIKSCFIFNVSHTTQYVICCFFSRHNKKTTWFIVFDWWTICVSFPWRMINLFEHGCDEAVNMKKYQESILKRKDLMT